MGTYALNTNEDWCANCKLEIAGRRLGKIFEQMTNLLPDKLRGDFKKYAFIRRGAIYGLYNGQEPADYDFFLTSGKYAKTLSSFFRKFAPRVQDEIRKGIYQNLPLVITRNAITVGSFQIITRCVGTIQKVVSEFDFKHNLFAFKDGEILNFTGWGVLESKEITFNGDRPRDICGAILRLPKFINRGMTINRAELRKMLVALSAAGFSEDELAALNSNDDYDNMSNARQENQQSQNSNLENNYKVFVCEARKFQGLPNYYADTFMIKEDEV